MAAFSKNFPWISHSGNYKYFEDSLSFHDKIDYLKRVNEEGLYEIGLLNKNKLRIFICDCYFFGVADYHEVIEKVGKIDCIVINSLWCGYSSEVKEYCKLRKIGVFKFGEFIGAINLNNYWEYISKEERERLKRK